jgi:hypothetical protein
MHCICNEQQLMTGWTAKERKATRQSTGGYSISFYLVLVSFSSHSSSILNPIEEDCLIYFYYFYSTVYTLMWWWMEWWSREGESWSNKWWKWMMIWGCGGGWAAAEWSTVMWIDDTAKDKWKVDFLKKHAAKKTTGWICACGMWRDDN